MRKPTRPRYPAPILLPAERADIPDLVRITIAAESASVISFLCYPSPEHRARLARDIIKKIDEVFDSPQFLLMKALDADTREITAMAAWQLKGYKKEELGMNVAESEETTRFWPAEESTFASGLLVAQKVNGNEEPGGALMKHIISHNTAFFDSWTKGTKHIYLAILMTDPRFQRRGIGTALLEWGHKLADQDGVPAFLVASPVGHPLYQSVGWKDVGEPFQLELKDWVKYAEKGDMGWGTYKYYYMLRMPKTAVDKKD